MWAGKCVLLRTGFNWHKFSRTKEISGTYHSHPPAESTERNACGWCRGMLCAGWASSLKASSGLGWNREIYYTDNTQYLSVCTITFICVYCISSRNPCLHFQLFPDQCSWPQREDALQHRHMRSQMDFTFLFLKDFGYILYYLRENSIPTCFGVLTDVSLYGTSAYF